jgi:hypothetical protein
LGLEEHFGLQNSENFRVQNHNGYESYKSHIQDHSKINIAQKFVGGLAPPTLLFKSFRQIIGIVFLWFVFFIFFIEWEVLIMLNRNELYQQLADGYEACHGFGCQCENHGDCDTCELLDDYNKYCEYEYEEEK